MACNKETEPEWDEFLEDCADKAVKLDQKRRQDAYDKKEADAQKFYSKLRQEIDDDKTIKRSIVDAMSLGHTSLKFYARGQSWSYIMHCPDWRAGTGLLDDKHFIKVFKTKSYGDKILVDLLREKFPKPVKIIVCEPSWNHSPYVKIKWPKKKK